MEQTTRIAGILELGVMNEVVEIVAADILQNTSGSEFISMIPKKEETVISPEINFTYKEVTESVPADTLQNTASELNRLSKAEVKDEGVRDIHADITEELDLKYETCDIYIENKSEKKICLTTGHNNTDSSNTPTGKSLQNLDTQEKTDKTKSKGKKKPTNSKRGRKYTTKFKCFNCGYETYDKSNLTKHIQSHSKIKQFKCQFCNKSFSVKRGLDQHIFHNHHSEAKELKENLISHKIYKCDLCDFQDLSSTTLKYHKVIRHASSMNLKTLECYNCDYETKVKINLINHMRTMHSKIERKYNQCLFCECKFLVKTSLACHILRKHKDKMNASQVSLMWGCKICVCRICPYECVNSNEMKLHMLSHGVSSIPKEKCEICGFETYTKYRLRKHEQTHNRAKPPQDRTKVKCQTCDYATNSTNLLRRHEMIHSRERPYVCFGCHKTFVRRSSMDGHIIVRHPNDEILMANVKSKSYKCESCSYRTLKSKELERHLSVRHNNVIEDNAN